MTKKELLRLKRMMLDYKKELKKTSKVKTCVKCGQSFLGHAGTHEPLCEYCEARIRPAKVRRHNEYLASLPWARKKRK